MSAQRKARFKPVEMKHLDKLKRDGETERQFILRLAGIDAEPIPMGRPLAADRLKTAQDALHNMFEHDRERLGPATFPLHTRVLMDKVAENKAADARKIRERRRNKK